MKKPIAIMLQLVLLVASSYARSTYSLNDLYQLALSRNITVQQALNRIKANIADRKTAEFNLLPSLSFGMQHNFSFGKNIDPVTNTFRNETFSGGSLGLGLQLKIFSGFNSLYLLKQKKYLVNEAEYAKKKIELELLQQVTVNYSRLLLDKEQAKIERENIIKTTKELEIVSEKIKLGKVTKYEYYVLDARKNTQEANLITVQNDSLAVLQELRYLCNISYRENIDVASIDTIDLAHILSFDASKTDFIDRILQKHPAVQQAKMDESIAHVNEKIARSSLYPSISLGGRLSSGYNINQRNRYSSKLSDQLNNNLGQSISIGLQIPIFSQRETVNRIKKEKINISNAEYAIVEAENLVISNVLKLMNDFNSTRQKYKASLAAYRQNNLFYSMYQEKYKLGQASSLELITAKDILDSSNSKYLQAKFELFFQYKLFELLEQD